MAKVRGFFTREGHRVIMSWEIRRHRYEICVVRYWHLPYFERDQPEHWGGKWALEWILGGGPFYMFSWLRRKQPRWERQWELEFIIRKYLKMDKLDKL